MNDEAAFLNAIRAAPEADAPRLVYADWLQERSDPRANYLRADVGRVWSESSGQAARAGMAVLSLLARPLDLAWLTTISLVGVEVGRAWSNVTRLREVRRNGPAPADPIEEWRTAISDLNAVVGRNFGQEFAEHRLCMPVDYVTFLCADGGKWMWDEWGDIHRGRTLSPTLEDHLESDLDQRDHCRESGAWLHLADWHHRDGYYLCADAGHPLFGVVAAEDSDFWVDRPDSLRFVAPTFLHFLRDALPEIVRGFPPWSADFTVEDWLRNGQTSPG